MKNKKNTDEQDFSLFDGQEEAIEKSVENITDPETEEVYNGESAPALFENETGESDDPYYDEADVVMTEHSDEELPALEEVANTEQNEESPTDSENSEAEDTAGEQTEKTDISEDSSSNSEEKPRRINSIFDFVELFVFTLAAVFIITSFFFKYSSVIGDSMQDTLQSGDKLLLSTLFYDPKPGDIVVIDDRSLKDPIVKRVIAVGGQTVKVTSNAIYVDGEKLSEDYVLIDNCRTAAGKTYQYSTEPCDELMEHVTGYQHGEYYEIRVPENEVFVLGDHRDNSNDSRTLGTFHEDAVLGKAILRFFPFDNFGKID